MRVIADLHIHSKYSRACSKELELPNIAKWCEKKGISVCATGDFTHPGWFSSIREELEETGPGVFELKSKKSPTKFILGTEISCIYKKNDQVRRLHHNVFFPKISDVEKFNNALEERGCNLKSDGRPIIGLQSKELLKIALDIDEKAMLIPAHAWTPWFAIFGSKSGYDSIEECFEYLSPHVHAIETGLSSDPAMNWRLSSLDNIMLVSNSDAHSLPKLGREANVFELDEVSYENIFNIIRNHDTKKFLYTIEFYPEEGKYHYDGHRDCNLRLSPKESAKHKGICPQCGKKLTLGVMNRVDKLADHDDGRKPKNFVPFKSIVPLEEILSEVFDKGVKTKIVSETYEAMIDKLGSEFDILLDIDINKIKSEFGDMAAEAIKRVREGEMIVEPGYDGEFGTVKIFSKKEKDTGKPKQKALF